MIVLVTTLPPLSSATGEEPGPSPTLIVWNSRVWTGNPAAAEAQAVAIEGNRILAVGADDEILALRRSSTRLVDGRGGTVLPGFIDAHFHLLDLGPAEVPVNLRWIAGKGEFIDAVAEHSRSVPEGEWVLGEGWDERKWGGEWPSRGWIDAVTPHNPVWLLRNRGGAGLANSVALQVSGITRDTPGPLPAGILRDSTGEPTGLIRGGPMWLIDKAVVAREEDAAARLVEARMHRLCALGVTSVHHTGSWRELLVFRRLHREGRLRTRIYAGVPLPAWERLRDYVAVHGRGDHRLRWGGLKLFPAIPWLEGDERIPTELDRWAALPTEGEVFDWLLGASQARLQIMVHAGDDRFLRMFNRVHDALGGPDLRFRIEHAHDVPGEWIPLFKRAGVIASMQPPLLSHFDIRMRQGQPRPVNLFPCRQLLDAGVVIAFGTDAVTATRLSSPFAVIQAALQRPGPDGRRLILEDCLTAYTRAAAYAEFAEREKGTIEPGKLADLVLLDRDLLQQPSDGLAQTRVVLTVIDGAVVYETRPKPLREHGR